MAFQGKNEALSYDAKSNFGFKGWWIIIFSGMNWYMYGGLVNSSMNTVVPQLSGKLGVDPGNLLSLSTPAGLIALVFCLVIGRIAAKTGVKNINGILLILGAAAVFLWAGSSSVASYTIALICMVCLMNGVQLAGGNMTITNWFPKKKGIAIGWATIGLNISSATFVAILVALTAYFGGIQYALYVMAVCLLVLAVVNFTLFKNFPEEWNAYPDNNPNAKREEKRAVRTGWTIGKVLRQKDIWFMGIGTGIYGMVTIGFVSTLVPSLIMRGFEPPMAILMMTVVSAIGAVGSYLTGFLDQKIGAQKASVLYGIFVIVGIIFFLVPGSVGIWVYLVMIGLSIGGSNNFPPSMTAQMFGRDGAAVAFPVVFFIKGLLCASPYLILGQSLARTGSYNTGWIIFAILTAVGVFLFYNSNLNPKKDPIDE